MNGPDGFRPIRWPSGELEDEVVLLAAVTGPQDHLAARVPVGTRPARDREDAVARVVERPLDGDLASRQERRPQALPDAFLRCDTRAEALVVADLFLIGGVELRVVEGQDVALHILAAAGRNLGIRDGVLDDVHGG